MSFKNIQFKNIKFIIFEENDSIDNYIVEEICKSIEENGGINLSIELRPEFSNVFSKLKTNYKREKISFEESNFFVANEFIYNSSNWKFHEKSGYFKDLEKDFFKEVDFKKENIHRLVTADNFYNLFNDKFAVYDSIIDKKSGIDLLIGRVNKDGSLLLNDKIDLKNLSTKGVKFSDATISSFDDKYLYNHQMPKFGATLGIDQILKTKKIVLVANGMDKSPILLKLFFSKFYDKLTPLCLMKSHPEVVILSDLKAAQGIMKYINITDKVDANNFYDGDQIINNFDEVHQGNYDFETPIYEEQYHDEQAYGLEQNYDAINPEQEYYSEEQLNPEYENYFEEEQGNLAHHWAYDDGEHQIIYQEADASYIDENNQVVYTNPDRIIYRSEGEEMVFYDTPNEMLYDNETNQVTYKHNNDELPSSYAWNVSEYEYDPEQAALDKNNPVRLIHNYDDHEINMNPTTMNNQYFNPEVNQTQFVDQQYYEQNQYDNSYDAFNQDNYVNVDNNFDPNKQK